VEGVLGACGPERGREGGGVRKRKLKTCEHCIIKLTTKCYDMLLCHEMLCSEMICHEMLCSDMLCYAMKCYAML
jgi:hypothetical protein